MGKVLFAALVMFQVVVAVPTRAHAQAPPHESGRPPEVNFGGLSLCHHIPTRQRELKGAGLLMPMGHGSCVYASNR